MKCLVCGKIFEGTECPRCEFPVVNVPGVPGSLEAGMKALQPTIDEYRAKFLSRYRVGVTGYRWKNENGKAVLERKERFLLGNVAEMMYREVWLSQKFARIPDAAELQLQVCIEDGPNYREVPVCLPNLLGAELQELGMKMDESLKLRLLLRNGTEGPVTSDGIALLEED